MPAKLSLKCAAARAAVIVLMLGATSLPATAQDSDESAMSGRELYVSYQCWQCHGYEGQGGAAPRIATTAYPFEAFAQFVRFPNLMPAYTQELLSDEKLRSILAFLRSQPEPPPLEDIPLLRE